MDLVPQHSMIRLNNREGQGAEEVMRELTRKNTRLGEQNEHLRSIIEELEAHKELSDELEVNHLGNAKLLQEAITHKGSLMMEQNRRITQ